MKYLKIACFLFILPLFAGSVNHKFYVSITKIEYVSESGSLQIITQIFIDDIEKTLENRYNTTVSLGTPKETTTDTALLKEYILQKLKIQINGKPVKLQYIGREYDTDMVKAYIEVEGIARLNTLEIENKILMDEYDEQQNIIHFKTKKTRRSLILDTDNPKGMLNFE
jgi:uncharacterized protein YuzE